MNKVTLIFISLFLYFASFSQTSSLDSLKKEVMELKLETRQIQLNIETSKRKFKSGILVATIGYTVTIAGGLMLGRQNDELGQILLVGGGVTGITGTYMMVNAFNYLSGSPRKKKELTRNSSE